MVVRCPFCVLFDDFLRMNIHGGKYVCWKCGHIAMPESKDFRCTCDHCVALDAFNPHKEQARFASA